MSLAGSNLQLNNSVFVIYRKRITLNTIYINSQIDNHTVLDCSNIVMEAYLDWNISG